MKRKYRFLLNMIAGTVAAMLLLCSCTANQEKIETDMNKISARLTAAGYTVQTNDPGSELLSALEDEMNGALDEPAEKALQGYLFAHDQETGELVLELFVFEDAGDARKLFDHLKDNDTFLPGVSEIRIDGKVVYMGYIEALDCAETLAA